MSGLLVGVGAFFGWIVLWLVTAGLLTFISLAVAIVSERRFFVPEQRTFLVWVAALTVCPALVFAGHVTLSGLLVGEQFYGAVRFGALAAGLAYIPIGVLVVNRPGEREDKKYEVFTLVGSSVVDLLCCSALLWNFEPISRYMMGVGG